MIINTPESPQETKETKIPDITRTQVRAVKLFEHEQKEQWYLDINPNGRIPAIVDTGENGQELKIWESGAILQYLVDRYDEDHKISYPRGTKEHWEMTSWVNS
jgi:glutathione S-transferase